MPVPEAVHVLHYLRTKCVLLLILTLSATYSLYSFSTKSNFLESAMRKKLDFVKTFQDDTLFTWNLKSSEKDEMVPPANCRNSLQGKDIIVDDRGYVCHHADLLPNGCCFTNVTSAKRYVCDSCLTNNCCEVYEHCLSCCLNPEKRFLLESVLKKMNSRFQFILSMTKDQYELCLVKCRTNSQSVYRGNMYRCPDHKYCYGELVKTGTFEDTFRKFRRSHSIRRGVACTTTGDRKCESCTMIAATLQNGVTVCHKEMVWLRLSNDDSQ